jgi:hypothetical protein
MSNGSGGGDERFLKSDMLKREYNRRMRKT